MSDQAFERLMKYVVLPMLIAVVAALTFGAVVTVVIETIARIGAAARLRAAFGLDGGNDDE